MGIRERYEHGVFCWVDLATSDPEAAQDFYGELLGWSFEDRSPTDAPPYWMALKGDRSVAALFPLAEEMQTQQIPPHWQSYINVTDIDATLATWQAQGGTVISPAFAVMNYGRMAIVQDPTGAMVNLWQAQDHIGAGRVNEVNTFCWTELQTRGSEQAMQFYQSVLGWVPEVDEKPPHYVTCRVQGRLNCGIFDLDKINLPLHVPSAWAVYFNVADLDAALDIVKRRGGKAMIDIVTIEPGRFVTIADPQGAVLTLMEVNNPDD
ncbi:MAG: VOC family protein [Cyanobacteria bacterium P01_G01_bin.54]